MAIPVDPQRDRKLSRVLGNGPLRKLRKGEVLYRRGDPSSHVFRVEEGYVCLTLPTDGEERAVDLAGPGELFGEEALVSSIPRLYGSCAGEATVLRSLEGKEALRAVRGSRKSHDALLEHLVRELAEARRMTAGSWSPPTPRRLAELVLELCDRLGSPQDQNGGLHVPHWIPHRVLAELSGAHRSTVTTLLNDWSYRGLLRHDRRSLVLMGGKDALLEATERPD